MFNFYSGGKRERVRNLCMSDTDWLKLEFTCFVVENLLTTFKLNLFLSFCLSVLSIFGNITSERINHLSEDYPFRVNPECGRFCFQTIQPVTDLIEIERKPS